MATSPASEFESPLIGPPLRTEQNLWLIVRGKGPPEGGPEGSGGFACRCVGLFDLRLANDDLRAVEREIIELHVEAPNRRCGPRQRLSAARNCAHRFWSRRKPGGRAVVCLAHMMFLSSWFESHAPCAASWGTKARAEQRRVQRRPAGHREAARSWQGAEATETSGLEGDARAGISPINSKPLVLAF